MVRKVAQAKAKERNKVAKVCGNNSCHRWTDLKVAQLFSQFRCERETQRKPEQQTAGVRAEWVAKKDAVEGASMELKIP